jgi:hypothetical protein
MISSQIRNPIPSKTKRSAGAAAFVTNCWSAMLRRVNAFCIAISTAANLLVSICPSILPNLST